MGILSRNNIRLGLVVGERLGSLGVRSYVWPQRRLYLRLTIEGVFQHLHPFW